MKPYFPLLAQSYSRIDRERGLRGIHAAGTGRAKYILGEFGIGFNLVMAVLATYFWMRRAEVVQPR